MSVFSSNFILEDLKYFLYFSIQNVFAINKAAPSLSKNLRAFFISLHALNSGQPFTFLCRNKNKNIHSPKGPKDKQC